jgi:soluble lytic murein transglycosylase-like protein
MDHHQEGVMTIKPRGLNGTLQRMHELQARVNMLTPQARDERVGEPAPSPMPLKGQFSEFLNGKFAPLNPMAEGLVRSPDRAPADILALIQGAANKAGIDPALFEALVFRESSFKPDAVSIAGAKGLAQLMPKTAASLGVTDIFDPGQNLDAGARYLAQMLRQFEGNKELALAAYNAGPGTVRQVGGIPPESAAYVRDVLQRAAEIGGTND